MSSGHDVSLAQFTTLRVGGVAREFIECESEVTLLDAVRSRPDALVVGGGSNLLIGDDPHDLDVVAVRTRGVAVELDACAGAWVTVAAGESWDALVERAVVEEWSGIEALAGIPGLVGATPIQNVGAYGQEVASVIARVRAFDRRTDRVVTIAGPDCGFGYRWSMFKAEAGRYVVLDVAFQLPLGSLSAPVHYAELANVLGIDVGERAPVDQVRSAVLALRSAKGMVLDATDHDTWSAGSFFLNPVLPVAAVPEGAVSFPQADGSVKVSAAWLIGAAGCDRGFALPDSRAAISGKHTLAITNRGGATAKEVVDLAREVRDRVRDRFGIELEPEPTLVACSL